MTTTSFTSRTAWLGAAALGLLACGTTPPSGSSTTDAETSTTTTTTTETTETGEPGETETETGDPTTEGVTIGPDMAPLSCDPFAQDCPEGEKCVPYASSGGATWDAHKCVPILGDQVPGEPCTLDGVATATDDCDASSYCWEGICHALCTGTPADPMCPPGYACSISGEGVLTLCLFVCDPLAQDCPADDGCYWTGNQFNCIPTSEATPVGEPCGFVNECAPGLACIMGEAVPGCADAACCSSFCSLAAGDGPCEAQLPGTTCLPFWGEAPPGSEDVGVCATPP